MTFLETLYFILVLLIGLWQDRRRRPPGPPTLVSLVGVYAATGFTTV